MEGAVTKLGKVFFAGGRHPVKFVRQRYKGMPRARPRDPWAAGGVRIAIVDGFVVNLVMYPAPAEVQATSLGAVNPRERSEVLRSIDRL
jgi:hypothetical protein